MSTGSLQSGNPPAIPDFFKPCEVYFDLGTQTKARLALDYFRTKGLNFAKVGDYENSI